MFVLPIKIEFAAKKKKPKKKNIKQFSYLVIGPE